MESVTVTWEGMPVEATVPPRIAGWQPDLSVATVRRTERAAAATATCGLLGAGPLEAAARLLLRAEGLASSAIEGLRASAADVAIAEATEPPVTDTAAWVADNLAVVSDALATPGPLSAALLFGWHRRLMRSSPTIEPRHVGAYRDTLGWVGGATLRLATHVATPPDLIPAAMDDLFTFAARDDVDPITHAAIVHAQFETIHPFADGNGRLGRVVIGRTLSQRIGVLVPPPVSLQMARDVGGYQAGLTLYRQDQVDPWVAWFADAVSSAADRAAAVLAAVADLQAAWRDELEDLRADAAARALIQALPAHPVLSTATAADLAGVTRRAAANALAALEHRGILVNVGTIPRGRGRPEQWWVAEQLLTVLGRW